MGQSGHTVTHNFFGDPAGDFGGLNPTTSIIATSDGNGYWAVSSQGAVLPYGDATSEGSISGTKLNGAIVASAGW